MSMNHWTCDNCQFQNHTANDRCIKCNTPGQPEPIEIPELRTLMENQIFDEGDAVNHPKHYTQGNIEVIDFILDQKMNYLEGNITKYVARYRFKNGLEDLKKAEFYLRRLIECLEQQS